MSVCVFRFSSFFLSQHFLQRRPQWDERKKMRKCVNQNSFFCLFLFNHVLQRTLYNGHEIQNKNSQKKEKENLTKHRTA
jgi:hypothetical protein